MNGWSQIRQSVLVSAALLAALFLLPLLVVSPFREEQPRQEPSVDEPAVEQPLPAIGEKDSSVTLRVLDRGAVKDMSLGEYLRGVVSAEMPASFHIEALKAQTVAARTYTKYKLLTGSSHGQTADICTDSTCCQAYIAPEQARVNWGVDGAAYEEKVAQAVAQTDGQTLLYEGEPILAVFHASSAGLTRPAGAVWQTDLPYLVAVESPERGEEIPNYDSRAAFTAAEFRSKIKEVYPQAELSGAMSGWLKRAVVDSAGSVETLEVGGVLMKGSTLRSVLGLRSACFEWAVEDGMLVFYVTGHGHGVGLSQYGANAMAESGADYREILTHYYTDVTIEG